MLAAGRSLIQATAKIADEYYDEGHHAAIAIRKLKNTE
jgi:hypothetical protein